MTQDKAHPTPAVAEAVMEQARKMMGAIGTAPSGRVELWPVQYRNALAEWFAKGYFAALATLPSLPAAQEVEGVDAVPPFGSKRAAALALYEPPFHFLHGYIYGANNKMVADQDGFEGAVHEHVALRVRGWGRIGYMPDAAALQDEVGATITEALTAFWDRALAGGAAK